MKIWTKPVIQVISVVKLTKTGNGNGTEDAQFPNKDTPVVS